ncbi:MAG: magnesium/cobalt efflux protein [Flammeovirgaceae bacterium]|nr:magnesium/cobalt efflux protein [Flammeovirgaceae bacterium]
MDEPPPIFLMEFVALSSSFYWGFGLLILFLLALSGLISGAEVAFFSLDKTGLEEEKRSDLKIKTLLKSPHQLLATILILNNLFNVFIVTLSTYVSWKVVGQKEAEGIILIVLTAVISILIIFFGEIVPKISAAHQPQKFARFCLPYIWFFNHLLKPLSWLLIGLSGFIEKRVKKRGYNLSVEDLNQALNITSEQNVSKEEKDILKGIVNFGTLSVRQIMRSRVDISAIERTSDFHELMDQINKTGFSRIPVYLENIDKIEGLLYIKDMLPFLHEEENFHWQQFLRPVYFIPESKKIDTLFKDFQEKQVHMAIVVDEYGGTEGLITMEDIIEEIVGEINDEFDDTLDTDYKKIDDNTAIFEGKTSLNDFCKIMSEEVDVFDEIKGESESLGGLLLEINKKLPLSNEKIEVGKFLFLIESVDQKRIKRVRVFRKS